MVLLQTDYDRFDSPQIDNLFNWNENTHRERSMKHINYIIINNNKEVVTKTNKRMKHYKFANSINQKLFI